MGRMADARKRARRSGGDEGREERPKDAAAAAHAQTPGQAVARDEEQAPDLADARRIELPSSGLASEVLSRMDAKAVPAEPPPDYAPAGAAPGEPPPPPHMPAETGSHGHSLSFFAAPAHEQRAAAEATEHLATFLLEGEEYGVDVRQVQEIRRVEEITTVPRAPEFVRGVINLRGRILPVLDLKRKLGLGQVKMGRAARIVVVRVRERLLGLLVDGASQVLKVPVSRVEAAPDEVTERGGDYIRGVAKLDDRLIILIDLGRALAQEIGEADVAART